MIKSIFTLHQKGTRCLIWIRHHKILTGLLIVLLGIAIWFASKPALPNGYSILVGSHDYYVYHNSLGKRIPCYFDPVFKQQICYKEVLPMSIVDYAYNDKYIMVLRMVAEQHDCPTGDGRVTYDTIYSDKKEYYAIELATDKILGPYAEWQFFYFLARHQLKNPKLTVSGEYTYNLYGGGQDECAKALGLTFREIIPADIAQQELERKTD